MNAYQVTLVLVFGALLLIVVMLFLPVKRSRATVASPSEGRVSAPIFRDDDRFWVGGLFYNNPDDPDVFVPKRFGWGWTLNLGHPQARLVILLLAVGVLGLMILPLLVPGVAGAGCHPSGCHPFP